MGQCENIFASILVALWMVSFLLPIVAAIIEAILTAGYMYITDGDFDEYKLLTTRAVKFIGRSDDIDIAFIGILFVQAAVSIALYCYKTTACLLILAALMKLARMAVRTKTLINDHIKDKSIHKG